jgi:hypothetical protein
LGTSPTKGSASPVGKSSAGYLQKSLAGFSEDLPHGNSATSAWMRRSSGIVRGSRRPSRIRLQYKNFAGIGAPLPDFVGRNYGLDSVTSAEQHTQTLVTWTLGVEVPAD